MEESTSYDDDAQRRDDPERNVRLHVHLALASIFLVLLAPVVSWTAWLFDRHLPGARRWKRRLLALAVLDTAIVVGLGLSSAFGLDLERASGDEARIGVVLETSSAAGGEGTPRGVVVGRILPGSPAAAAGLEPGDRITTVDGAPVDGRSQLVSTIARTEPGGERRLAIVRGGEHLERVVVPTTESLAESRMSKGLFEPVELEQEIGRTTGRPWAAAAGLAELVLVGVLAAVARRRRARVGPAVAVVCALLALSLVSSLVLLAFRVTLGVSTGAFLVAILSGSAALMAVGLLAAARAPRGPVQVGPRLDTAKAVALGMLYGVTGAARVAAVLAIVVAALDLPMRTASEAFGVDPSWGVLGVGLFVLATVVVAPVAEEVLFRGVLLPWLARWMRPTAALAWTTVVFAIGHLYYGAGVVVIALYGLVFGWARLRTGGLRAPIVLHAMLNGATTVALLFTSR